MQKATTEPGLEGNPMSSEASHTLRALIPQLMLMLAAPSAFAVLSSLALKLLSH